MKILFTAPRFHTNQVPIVKGLVEKGHQVRFFVAFEGAIEDHTYCQPLVLKPSRYTVREKRRLSKTKSESDVESIIGGHFIPDFAFLETAFTSFMPDFVICREKTNLTLCVHALCQESGIPCVLYDQAPFYPLLPESRFKEGATKERALWDRLRIKAERALIPDLIRIASFRKKHGFPLTRITPVLYQRLPKELSALTPFPNSHFIPFVAEKHPEAQGREYCKDGVCRFLCIGKFREYKNLKLVLEAANQLSRDSTWRITLIGQAVNQDEQKYYEEVCQIVCKYSLDNSVQIKKNILHKDIGAEYLKHDVFILPSKKEMASIAVLEAMSYGLPVISTDHNGTASYITDSVAGTTFSTDDAKALAEQMEKMMKSEISDMGKKALVAVKNEYDFRFYYEKLLSLCHQE